MVFEQACWFCSVAVRCSLVSVSFTKKRMTPVAQQFCPSCLAQKLFPNCFQHDPDVVIKLPQQTGFVVGVGAILFCFGNVGGASGLAV